MRHDEMNKKNWSKNENGDNETVEFFFVRFFKRR